VGSGPLSGKRVLILGAETEAGRSVASAIGAAGADLALAASTPDPQTGFEIKRLARRLDRESGHVISQAIDAGNEMAVRVTVRQVAK
jgi:NAD(P)-dependent dehydrogenase (short-subunit alcohol dehydrogenase family)